MAKNTAKTETPDVFSFSGFSGNPFADQFREMAEQGLSRSREAYEAMKTGMEDVQKTIESTFDNAQQQSTRLSQATIDAMRANAELGFSHLEKMAGAKTFAEAIESQTAFFRAQAELGLDQAKNMQAMSREAFEAVSAPAKEQTEKAMDKAAEETKKAA